MEFYENILNNSSSMEVEAIKNKGFLACMDPLDEALLLGSRDLECLAKSLEVKNGMERLGWSYTHGLIENTFRFVKMWAY